jgi:hypothetical protein
VICSPNHIDVRHDPQRTDGASLQRAAGEEAIHAEQTACLAGVLLEELRQGRPVEAGDRDQGNQPANRQDEHREEDPRLQLRNLEAVGKGAEDCLEHMPVVEP